MKRKTILLSALAFSAVMFTCFASACGNNDAGYTEGEPYEYTFNKPFAGTPDEDMKIDGNLNEEAWQNKKYLAQTVKKKAWEATTHFTARGVYIAVKVTDPNMVYRTRYTARSYVNVYLCKTGMQTYGLNSLSYHEARCFQFQLDPYYCRSIGRVPYNYKAHVEGELNSETTCTMTAELFLTWKDLYYTQEELGENGYPEDIQMYVNYNSESTEVLGTCLWREETYFAFNKNGYTGGIDDPKLGSVEGGLAATDRWERNENGNLQTTAGRTQILWMKDAYAKDFMFEAKLKPLDKNPDGTTIKLRGDKVYGRFGLITENSNANYSVYSSEASGAPATLQLQTCRHIDSFHWQNPEKIGVRGNKISTGITEDFITLRLIKQGDMFYYFYGDTYWKSERIQDLQDSVYCGIFTSQGVEILDCKFENYEGKEATLTDKLSEYMYFVNVPGVSTYGSVTSSLFSVPKGESVTISFIPKSKGVLTGITMDGIDKYEEIVEEMNDECEYTFTPDNDVTFTATFGAFNSDALVRTVVAYKDNDDNLIKDGAYEIRGNEKLLFYKGTPNDSGYIILYVPKEGRYEVDGRTFDVSGTYDLITSFSSYHTSREEFTLNDDTTSVDIYGKPESVRETKSYTGIFSVESNAYGSVKINGKTVTGSGEMSYNEETGNYYTTSAIRRYYKSMVGIDYNVKVTIDMSEVANPNGDLAGLAITNGSYVIVFKLNLNVFHNLIIATGASTTNTTAELAIGDFGWAGKIQKPTATEKGSGKFTFRIVKCGSAIYLFDSSGAMKAYFNQDGVHLVNGTSLRWGADKKETLNVHIGKFFSTGLETAVGVFTYKSGNIRAEFDFDFTDDIEKVHTPEISFGNLTVNIPVNSKFSETLLLKKRDGYAKGEYVKFGIEIADAKNVCLQMLITDIEGTRTVEGIYDWSNKCIVFKFEYRGGNTQAVIAAVGSGGLHWSDEWGEFNPSKDNTRIEEVGT